MCLCCYDIFMLFLHKFITLRNFFIIFDRIDINWSKIFDLFL